MEIIKQGDTSKLKNPKHFICATCGCEFIADNTEYICNLFFDEYYYSCNCPSCNRCVYAEE
jgi:hypothetical protein